jgi:biotin-[acetyl-CoA-carboxylase] ligase BirA-like protein
LEVQVSPLAHWEGESVLKLRRRWGLPALSVFECITSTNDIALREAERGASVGTTVIAEEQIRGRGQNGRVWFARAGKSLLLSIVLPSREPKASSLQQEVAIATARALRRFIGPESVAKMPNDVVTLQRRKLAGVLVERASNGSYVAGIGINVAQLPSDWPIELRASAQSLRRLGVTVPRRVLAGALIEELRPLIMGHPPALESTRIRRLNSAMAVVRDDNVTVRIDGEEHSGIWLVPTPVSRQNI